MPEPHPSQSTPSEAARARSRASFDAISAQYDGLRFVHRCAVRLVERAALEPGLRVLDLATGTGLVASLVAPQVEESGRVVGLDFSPGMLLQARARLDALDLEWVELLEGDAAHLPFQDAHFEWVLCASSLMFMPDMGAVLRECRRVLSPGGQMAFTGFGAGFLEPLHGLWVRCLERHGVTLPPPPIRRLAEPSVCQSLLLEAGFAGVEVSSEQLGYWLERPEDRLQEIRVGLEGLPLRGLSPEQRQQIEADHLKELRPLERPDGLWVDLPVHFASGMRTSA